MILKEQIMVWLKFPVEADLKIYILSKYHDKDLLPQNFWTIAKSVTKYLWLQSSWRSYEPKICP